MFRCDINRLDNSILCKVYFFPFAKSRSDIGGIFCIIADKFCSESITIVWFYFCFTEIPFFQNSSVLQNKSIHICTCYQTFKMLPRIYINKFFIITRYCFQMHFLFCIPDLDGIIGVCRPYCSFIFTQNKFRKIFYRFRIGKLYPFSEVICGRIIYSHQNIEVRSVFTTYITRYQQISFFIEYDLPDHGRTGNIIFTS